MHAGDERGLREEGAVFPIAADTGGAQGHGEVDGAAGVGAFGYEVASEDEVVLRFVEGKFFDELLDCVFVLV